MSEQDYVTSKVKNPSGESAVAKPATFEENLKERVKQHIMDLMPDEELSKIVHRIVDDIFFQEKSVKDGWGGHKRWEPPFLHKILEELLTPVVKSAVAEYIATHNDEVQKALQQSLKDGIFKLFLNAFDERINSAMYKMQSEIKTAFE